MPALTDVADHFADPNARCILDAAPEDDYDGLVQLAACVCGMPMAAVSLLDAHKTSLRAAVGLSARESSLLDALCAHTILQDDLMIVADAHADPRFVVDPSVTGEPSVRFYAGVPLYGQGGSAIGSLCVMDTIPRTLTPEQAATLQMLASQADKRHRAANWVAEQRTVAQREAEEWERLRLAVIVETSEDAIYSKTLDGIVTTWNAGAERLYGYTAAMMIGQSIDVIIPAERRSEVRYILAAIQRGETVKPEDTVRVTDSGSNVDVSLQVSPIRGAMGQVTGASVIARDITARIQAEAKLRESEQRLSLATRSAQIGIWLYDASVDILQWDAQMCKLYGIRSEGFGGTVSAWEESLHPEDRDGALAELSAAVEGKEDFHTQFRVVLPDGQVRHIEAHAAVHWGDVGQPLRIDGVNWDITDRKEMEIALRENNRDLAESQHFARSLTEHSASLIFVFDLETMSNVYANQELAEFLGYPHDKVASLGEDLIMSMIHPDDKVRVLAHFAEFGDATDGKVVEFEFRARHASGEWRWVWSREVVFKRHPDGRPWQILGNALDVTERRRTEEALAASQARLAEAQRVAKIGSWEYDIASGEISWSREMFRLVGRDETLGEPDYGANLAQYHPKDAAALADLVLRAVGHGEDYEIDLRLADAREDGQTQWRHAVGKVVRGADGQVVRLLGTLADITERKTLEAELRERAERLCQSEAALRAVLEGAPIVLYAADKNGIVTLSEGTGLAALGLRPGEVVGRSVFEFSGGDAVNEANTRRALAGEAVSFDARYGELCLHTALRPIGGAGGSPGGIIGVCFDVTERVRSEERFRVLFEQSPDAYLLLGEDGIIDCNGAAVAMLRCTDKAQVLSLHPAMLSPEFQTDGRNSLATSVEMEALAYKHGFQRFEWTHRKMDGEDFPVEVTLTPVTLGDRPVLLVVWHELTERKRVEERLRESAIALEFQKNKLEMANVALEELATTDGLTGLNNHRAFQERLAEQVSLAARYGTPLSLIMLDVDHFKQFNDAFGHPEGDVVLKAVSQVLGQNARETDIVARNGGEEFALILPQTELDEAVIIADRLRAAVEGHGWPKRAVTASFGVAVLRTGGESGADLIAHADRAMYQSKAEGRNRVNYTPDPTSRRRAVM